MSVRISIPHRRHRAMSNTNHLTNIQQITETLLTEMGFGGDVAVEERDGVFWVFLQLEDPRQLIGYRGEALGAFEHLVRVLTGKVSKEETPRVMVDINGYREQRSLVIQDLARSVADQVRFSKRSSTLDPMSAYERRIVHTTLAERVDVTTESFGEGDERRVVVKPNLF